MYCLDHHFQSTSQTRFWSTFQMQSLEVTLAGALATSKPSDMQSCHSDLSCLRFLSVYRKEAQISYLSISILHASRFLAGPFWHDCGVGARIRFYSQEIVLIREDLIYRMRRSCIITPSEEETKDPFEHVCSFLSYGFVHYHATWTCQIQARLEILVSFLLMSFVSSLIVLRFYS